MEDVASKFNDKVEFWTIYTREPHPGSNRNTAAPRQPHKDYKDKMDAAKTCVKLMKIKEWRMLVDKFNCEVQNAYGGLPNMVYIIGKDGKVAWKAAWTRAGEIEEFLKGMSLSDSGGPAGEEIKYKCEHLELKASLFTPEKKTKKDEKLPAIIYCHAGIKGVRDYDREFCSLFTKKGYIVVAPEFRGQGGSGGKIQYAGNEVKDVLSLLEHLKTVDKIDMDRVYLVGEKLGATVGLLACAQKLKVKACAAITPITDFPAVFKKDEVIKKNAEEHSGIKASDGKGWAERSPVTYKKALKVPLMLLHSGKNEYLSADLTKAFAKSVRAAGNSDVKVKTYSGKEHSLVKKSGKKVVKDILKFFKAIDKKKKPARKAK
ncbi:MAG: hypothetical protein E3J72_20225 [Planctomycetota bacterium]|nr:MAG: hypothetical protein E3J72_20225 [Planctomycetota bacterium]